MTFLLQRIILIYSSIAIKAHIFDCLTAITTFSGIFIFWINLISEMFTINK